MPNQNQIPQHACAENIHFHLNVQHFGNTNIKYLEVKGSCSVCRKNLTFRGPIGIQPSHPTRSLDGEEATFPFLFEGEIYDGKAVGYGVDLGRETSEVRQ